VIGYALPQSLLGKSFIRQASVSLVGRNLLYFAEKKDIDIEQYVNPGRNRFHPANAHHAPLRVQRQPRVLDGRC
jgi:hypothetical protein